MWKFVGDKKGLEPLPGLPLEASDKDFEDALKVNEAFNGEGAAAVVKAGGLYAQTKEAASGPAKED